GFDDMDSANDAAVAAANADETHEDDIIPIDNPLIDGLGFGAPSSAPRPASTANQDYDLDDIFKMLGN
ncbi:MAG: cell division protein FtsZ, partial [Ruminococcus sp.]|nr:cell division protein FtsZ [Ruminococcus sp.]